VLFAVSLQVTMSSRLIRERYYYGKRNWKQNDFFLFFFFSPTCSIALPRRHQSPPTSSSSIMFTIHTSLIFALQSQLLPAITQPKQSTHSFVIIIPLLQLTPPHNSCLRLVYPTIFIHSSCQIEIKSMSITDFASQ